MAFSYSALEVIQMALDVEEASSDFYRSLSASSKDPHFKDVFKTLSRQEASHKRNFESLSGDAGDPEARHDYPVDVFSILQRATADLRRQTIRTSAPVHVSTLKDALDLAVSAEKGAVEVYQLMRDVFGVAFGPVLDSIIETEKSHLASVTDLKKKLSES